MKAENKPPSAPEPECCNWCLELTDKINLKSCSRCRLAQYCSKECQRKAWPTHKKSCKTDATATSVAKDDPVGEVLAIMTDKWLAQWSRTILDVAILAMDLANSPRDKLATHVVFLEMEFRDPVPKERIRLFKVRGGKVMPREVYAEAMRYWNIPEEEIERWKRDKRGDRTLQVDLVCEGDHRTFWVPYRTLDDYWNADKKTSGVFGRTWLDVLRKKTEYGHPGFDVDSRWPISSVRELKIDATLSVR